MFLMSSMASNTKEAKLYNEHNYHKEIGLGYTIVHTKVKSMIHFLIVLCIWDLPERITLYSFFAKKIFFFFASTYSIYLQKVFSCVKFFFLL